ncbi:hypothetical protein PV773_08070 [Mesorhizobium sp. CC13]|uniref:hypothetical protein n=1 Tax=Mesorhizobium sp. CC13 TaxID=3029194 RepID=UPI0032649825
MVQSILFFVLGFLVAGFLVLLIAPSVWRRAVTMTRRRVEAKLPMTLDEIRAEKDALRATHAMELRKVEVQLRASQEKVLSQSVELSRNREVLKTLSDDQAAKGRAVTDLEAAGGDLRSEIGRRDDQIKQLAGKLAEAENLLEQRVREIDSLGELYEEASLASSNRQIELASRDSEMGKLSDDMYALRSQRKDVDNRLKDLEADNKAVRDALKAETRRAGELDKKLERMVASLSDRDDKLERRESELARLRERVKGTAEAPANGTAYETGLSAERERLEARLTTLARENKRLKGELAAANKEAPSPNQDALLREQMHELAAEVVALTARLEGPDSPIEKALSAEGPADNSGGRTAAISLADRVRALQKSLPAE